MKKTLVSAAIVIAMLAAVFGSVATASAVPTKTKTCSSCHRASSAVKITVTKLSQTSTKAKYRIKVTGGSGAAGWAALYGSKNLAHRTASTGTFTVARGKTYKVRAVKKGSGSAVKSLVVR